MNQSFYQVVILAAGSSSRFKQDKILAKLNNHQTVLDACLTKFINDQECKKIMVVVNPQKINSFIKQYQLSEKIHFTSGSTTRHLSMKNGLSLIDHNIKYVLIHDAARPFVSSQLLQRIKTKLCTNQYDCVIPVLKCVNSMIKVSDNHPVYVNRDEYLNVHTPQGFKTECLINLDNSNQMDYPDEFSYYLDCIRTPNYCFVDSDSFNIKITYPDDLIDKLTQKK